jgi:hypothetical protein
MLNNHKIVLNNFCEIDRLIRPFADDEFYDLTNHTIIPGAIYIIGREQFTTNRQLIKQLVDSGTIRAVLCNPAEGSESMYWLYQTLGIGNFTEHAAVITGGYLPDNIPHMYHEHFLPLILDYDENIKAIEDYKNRKTTDRPYKFLFLNGRLRVHRKYLLEYFRLTGLLDQSLWTNLDNRNSQPPELKLEHNGQDLINSPFPVHYLPAQYEVDRYQQQAVKVPTELSGDLAAKRYLFNNEWGDIYIAPAPYLDTYFSLVTETVFDYPYTFRTEKIWKPIAIGHPWIAATNCGYYRDMHNLGFKTFGHLIDESFDQIENGQDRIERITKVVEDLCRQDLPAFLTAAEDVCKYNQQLLAELRLKVRREFPDRFQQFINQQFNA